MRTVWWATTDYLGVLMNIDERLALSLDSLVIDVFDVVGADQTVESLTAGHGMAEPGALANSSCVCSCSIVPPTACTCPCNEPGMLS